MGKKEEDYSRVGGICLNVDGKNDYTVAEPTSRQVKDLNHHNQRHTGDTLLENRGENSCPRFSLAGLTRIGQNAPSINTLAWKNRRVEQCLLIMNR